MWAVIVAALASFATGIAAAEPTGLIVRQRRAGGLRSAPEEEVVFFGARKRVVDTPRVRTILDLDARTITVVNKSRQAFFVRTFEEVRSLNEQTEEQLQRFPDAVCSRFAAMGNVALAPTGRTETIAGVAAKEYAFEGGRVGGSVWIAEGVTVPAAAEWQRAIEQWLGGGKGMQSALAQMKGLVVRIRTSAAVGKNSDGETEAIEIRKGAPPRGLLEVPAGFRRVAPPLPRRR